MTGGILYRIQNIVTGNFYIGITSAYRLSTRSGQHIQEIRKYWINPTLKQIDCKNHGIRSFVFGEVAQFKTRKELEKAEIFYILKFNPPYNQMIPKIDPDYNYITVKDYCLKHNKHPYTVNAMIKRKELRCIYKENDKFIYLG